MLTPVQPVLALLPNADHHAKEQSVPMLEKYKAQPRWGMNPQPPNPKTDILPALIVQLFLSNVSVY